MTRLGLMLSLIVGPTCLATSTAPCDPPATPVELRLQWDGVICDPPLETTPGPTSGIIVVPVPGGTILRMQITPDVLHKTINGTIKVPVTWPPEAPAASRAPFNIYPGGQTPLRFPSADPRLDLRGLREPETRSPFDLDIGRPPSQR